MEHRQEFDSWALVELMGHQRIAGRVTEAEIGGCKFIRVDVPAATFENVETQALTKYLGPSSVYAITPVTEETARALARQIEAAPLSIWDARRLAKSLPATESPHYENEDDDGEEHSL
jgi:hypothetical protein